MLRNSCAALVLSSVWAHRCPDGYKQLGNTGDDVPDWGLSSVGNSAHSIDGCAAKCSADSKCGDFEWNAHGDLSFPDACALNSLADSTRRAQTGTWAGSITCKKVKNVCPWGYKQLGHTGDDVPDWGLSSVGNSAHSIEGCAAQCSADSECGDFEWNAHGDLSFPDACALNSWADSNRRAETGTWAGSITCRKVETVCPHGYKQLGHTGDDVPDWGLSSVGSSAQSMEGCAAQCSADSECGDFEWNERGDPSFPDACALNSWADSTRRAETGTWAGSITCRKLSTSHLLIDKLKGIPQFKYVVFCAACGMLVMFILALRKGAAHNFQPDGQYALLEGVA